MVILNIICIICYILHYSGFNYYFFKNNFSINSGICLGRYAENFPLAFTGFFLASIRIIDMLKNTKKQSYYICIVIVILINKYNIFEEKKVLNIQVLD